MSGVPRPTLEQREKSVTEACAFVLMIHHLPPENHHREGFKTWVLALRGRCDDYLKEHARKNRKRKKP